MNHIKQVVSFYQDLLIKELQIKVQIQANYHVKKGSTEVEQETICK